jgi:hypothetical protein
MRVFSKVLIMGSRSNTLLASSFSQKRKCMNVFPSSCTKTLYLRSVRCKARSSSITLRICSWFCAAYAACTTYRLVVMIIWTSPLFAWTKLSCSAILHKRVFIRSCKEVYEFLFVLSRGLPERPATCAAGAVWNEDLVHHMDQGKHAQPVQRRARGVQRIASILAAAETVFAEVGYDEANTNRIAARSGISPGSLYQFFSCSLGAICESG